MIFQIGRSRPGRLRGVQSASVCDHYPVCFLVESVHHSLPYFSPIFSTAYLVARKTKMQATAISKRRAVISPMAFEFITDMNPLMKFITPSSRRGCPWATSAELLACTNISETAYGAGAASICVSLSSHRSIPTRRLTTSASRRCADVLVLIFCSWLISPRMGEHQKESVSCSPCAPISNHNGAPPTPA